MPPKLLQIELTESVMLTGTERTADTMRRLGAVGVSIAIDDFGTGYSCFGYLPRLPFNVLKIDRGFVRDLGSVGMKAMIQSLVTLGHTLTCRLLSRELKQCNNWRRSRAWEETKYRAIFWGRPTSDPVSEIKARKAAEEMLADTCSGSPKESAMKASAK